MDEPESTLCYTIVLFNSTWILPFVHTARYSGTYELWGETYEFVMNLYADLYNFSDEWKDLTLVFAGIKDYR